MDILNFTLRLLKHGSIFLLKLLGFSIGVLSGVPARTRPPEEKSHFQKYQDAPYEVGVDGAVHYYDEY